MLVHASFATCARTARKAGSGSTDVSWSRKASIPSRTRTTPLQSFSARLAAGGAEEGVPVVARGDEGLLDRAGRDPADEVPHRAGLVVRPARAGAAEGLLADDRARGLVVDVEVAGRVAERVLGLF